MSSSVYTCFLATVGIILSSYALYVEHKTSHPTISEGIEEDFQALCDIEAISASCSQVFALPEGRLLSYFSIVPHDGILDVPNAALGLTYYSIIFFAELLLEKTSLVKKLTVAMSSAAMSSSIFLGIKLFQLRELCILCLTTHLLNALLLIFYVRQLVADKKTKKD